MSPGAFELTPLEISPGAFDVNPLDISPAKAEQLRISVKITVTLSLRTFFMDLSPSKGSESEAQLLRLDIISVFKEQR